MFALEPSGGIGFQAEEILKQLQEDMVESRGVSPQVAAGVIHNFKVQVSVCLLKYFISRAKSSFHYLCPGTNVAQDYERDVGCVAEAD